MRKSLSFVLSLVILGLISTANSGCKNLLPDKQLAAIKDSLAEGDVVFYTTIITCYGKHQKKLSKYDSNGDFFNI